MGDHNLGFIGVLEQPWAGTEIEVGMLEHLLAQALCSEVGRLQTPARGRMGVEVSGAPQRTGSGPLAPHEFEVPNLSVRLYFCRFQFQTSVHDVALKMVSRFTFAGSVLHRSTIGAARGPNYSVPETCRSTSIQAANVRSSP